MTTRTLLAAVPLLLSAAGAQSAGLAFDNQPTQNSVQWAAHLATLGSGVGLTLDFESHPDGALQDLRYLPQGVSMGLGGGPITANQVLDYRNNYTGTVSGYGPNSTGEGVAPETRAFYFYSPGTSTLTLDFAQPVLGAGLFVIDLFNGLGTRRVTLQAFDGAAGTGNLLATATAPDFNFQLYNQLFLGVANDSAVPTIRSVVFTNPVPYAGDSIFIDNIRIATAVPEPGAATLLLSGLMALAALARRRSA